jgi:hypothetical protein
MTRDLDGHFVLSVQIALPRPPDEPARRSPKSALFLLEPEMINNLSALKRGRSALFFGLFDDSKRVIGSVRLKIHLGARHRDSKAQVGGCPGPVKPWIGTSQQHRTE